MYEGEIAGHIFSLDIWGRPRSEWKQQGELLASKNGIAFVSEGACVFKYQISSGVEIGSMLFGGNICSIAPINSNEAFVLIDVLEPKSIKEKLVNRLRVGMKVENKNHRHIYKIDIKQQKIIHDYGRYDNVLEIIITDENILGLLKDDGVYYSKKKY